MNKEKAACNNPVTGSFFMCGYMRLGNIQKPLPDKYSDNSRNADNDSELCRRVFMNVGAKPTPGEIRETASGRGQGFSAGEAGPISDSGDKPYAVVFPMP